MRFPGDTGMVVGVDTHLDSHTAALCDGRGRLVAQLQVPATAAGYARLLAWAGAAAQNATLAWAVEGTRHYGLGLARHLTSAGQHVEEIDSSRHVGKRRAGKSDAIDAVRAARELLARPRRGEMRCDGDREALRLLMVDRDNAVASAKTARTLLASVLVTAPAPLRERLGRLSRNRRATVCAALACPRRADRQTRVLHQTLARLGQRIIVLSRVAAGLEKQIAVLVDDLAPGLLAAEPGAVRSPPRRFCCRSPTPGDPQRSRLRHAAGHSPGPGLFRPHRPAPSQSPRRPPAQPRLAGHRRQPDAQPPRHPGLRAAPPRRRQDRPGNPPLHQALPRPPPLPRPHQPAESLSFGELTNIGASD